MTGSAPRVVVISDIFRLSDGDARVLDWHGLGPEARHDLSHVARPADLVDALQGAWAVVAGSERYAATVLEQVPTVRAIARPGVGVDAIDVDAATRHGIAVLVTRGANDESVADHAVALILAGQRRIVELDQRTRAGFWRPLTLGRELSGSTVGIVGLGAIGRGVARRVAGFDCRIMAVEPRPDMAFCDAYGVTVLPLDEMLPQIDVLSVHVPLGPETRGLIGARELRRLPPHALVVNTARGGVIDEAALVEALEEGRIGGAALDVFEHEPFGKGDPLAGLPNVTLTPHHAAFTDEAVQRMIAGTIANLVAVRDGRLPPGCINRADLEAAVDRAGVDPVARRA